MKPNGIVAMLLLLGTLGPLVSGQQKEQIVVHTPLQNYEQPSLRDYDECQTNRQSCLDICAGKEECLSECPRCPELLDEPLLVQGINDTNYVPPAQKPLNTTNIIRLTNEINNIINNDILSRNEINVKVQQNVSQVGGRFGLGYSEQGACCYVVRRQRDCDHQEHCKESARQRVCGKRCQARVMLAKRVVQCEKDEPENCHETLEYVPARKRRNSSRHQSEQCRYSNSWPYVQCAGEDAARQGGRVRRASCQNCLELSYGYILQHGLPPHCYGCFQGFGVMPMMPLPMPMYYPNYNYMPNFGHKKPKQEQPQLEDNDLNDDDESGWIVKSQKCPGANGKLEDCVDGSGDFEYPVELPPAHLEQGRDKNEDQEKEDTDDGYNVPVQRRRRRHHQFLRSSYSRRHED